MQIELKTSIPGTGCLRFNFRAGQIGHKFAYGSPLLKIPSQGTMLPASVMTENDCCCCAYSFSCHRTASDVNYWQSAHFSLQWLLCARKNPHLLRSFHRSNILVYFFEFCLMILAACRKPSSRDYHRKASYPRTQERDQGGGWTDLAIWVVV